MAVRILRIIEYIYKDANFAVEDQMRWSHSVAPFAQSQMTMRDTVLPWETIEWTEPKDKG